MRSLLLGLLHIQKLHETVAVFCPTKWLQQMFLVAVLFCLIMVIPEAL